MLHTPHFRDQIVLPALNYLAPRLASPLAVNLLLGTAAQESQMGRYLVQLGGGPARGVFQMEPATHDDIWESFLRFHPDLADRIKGLLSAASISMSGSDAETLTGNLYYATAMCRMHYFRRPEPVPNTLAGQAVYWKRFYNTRAGAGSAEEYLRNWNKLVAPHHEF